MGNKFEFEPVTREDGTEVTPDEIQRTINKPVFLKFKYEGLTFSMAVMRSSIAADPVLRYRREISRMRKNSGLFDDEEYDRAMELIGQTSGLSDEEIDKVLKPEERKLIKDITEKLVALQHENEPALFPLKVEIVVPAIVGWNLPTHNHNIETFTKNSALAGAVIPVLWDWWSPSSPGSEAATAEIPTPSIPDSSSISSPTGNTESAPTSTSSS